jgi:predicted RNA methylase
MYSLVHRRRRRRCVGRLQGAHVLELGAGVANHSVLIHRSGPASLTMTEVNEHRLATTRQVMAFNACDGAMTRYIVADWLSVPPCAGAADGLYDALVTNPPFCQSGKANRRYFIDDLILNAHKVLRPGGLLVWVQSSMADMNKTHARLAENGWDSQIVMEKQYPWREYYYEDPNFVVEAQAVTDGGGEYPGFTLEQPPSGQPPPSSSAETERRPRRVERLFVVQAKLRPFTPHLWH